MINKIVYKYGNDILSSKKMQREQNFIQHGKVSVYEHSVNTAGMCIKIANIMKIKTDQSSLVRGALLHDYFLYDWHIPDKRHRFHAFKHAKTALSNAQYDFKLNSIEKNMIISHMFPLNISCIPHYRESIILCVADKICASRETLFRYK